MKHLAALFLCLLLLALPVSAEEITDLSPDISSEETAVPSGLLGENLIWILEENTLILSGTGEMADCSQGAPWLPYKDSIEKVVLKDGITTVGAGAFADYDNLKEVDFGDTLTEIGEKAFFSCDGLTELILPDTFKIFGEECFRDCGSLTAIHCSGGFPKFRLNCLWNSYLQIIYPAQRPWPVSLVQELEEAFHGRIEFRASDGTDPYTPAPEVTEPAVTVPETTVPETTLPEIQSPEPTETTLPEPTQSQQSQEQTIPETTQEPLPKPTEPAPVPKENTSFAKLVLILCGFTAVLSLGLLTVLLLKSRGGRGRYED